MCAEVGREILRVDVSLLNKRGEPEEDPRLLMKSVPAKPTSTAPALQEVSKVNGGEGNGQRGKLNNQDEIVRVLN